MKVEILGYGIYIPRYRIKISDIADVWGKKAKEIESSLGVSEKSVAGIDEDAVTLAYEAGKSALDFVGIPPSSIDVCFVGSESHPYAVNPTSTIVAGFLGLGNNYLASDLEFACKAATVGIIASSGLILAKKAKTALIIGTDKAQAKPHDILEYTAAAGAAAFIIGNSDEAVAEILDFSSYSSDTPDFWRRDGVRFPSHGGRFTGEPAYFAHVFGAARNLLNKTGMKPSDFKYCVFHSPNGKFPKQIAQRLGFTKDQLEPSFFVSQIGNPYSASTLIGLAKVLDQAKPKDKIFVASYGSGAGSDSFVIEATENILKRRNNKFSVESFIDNKEYISYTQYLRFTGKI